MSKPLVVQKSLLDEMQQKQYIIERTTNSQQYVQTVWYVIL